MWLIVRRIIPEMKWAYRVVFRLLLLYRPLPSSMRGCSERSMPVPSLLRAISFQGLRDSIRRHLAGENRYGEPRWGEGPLTRLRHVGKWG